MPQSPATPPPAGMSDVAGFAATAAEHLRCIANERRLIALYHLAMHGEKQVGSIAEAVGLRHSPMSQHLALLRKAEIVTPRRAANTVYYRLSDARVERLLHELWRVFRGSTDRL